MTEVVKRSFSVPIGSTVIIGSEYLSAPALDFIELALSVYPNSVRSISIDVQDRIKQKDKESKELIPVSGWHDPRTRSIDINLQEIFRQALAHTEPHEGASRYCAVRTELWSRFCIIMLHEVGHDYLQEMADDEKYEAVDEDQLTKWSIIVAMDMGKKHNMEPALWEHEPYFGKLFSEELEAAANDKEKEDWLLFQLELLDSALFFNDTETGLELPTYHEYQQHMSIDPTSKEWKTITVDIVPVTVEKETPVVPLPDKPVETPVVIALSDKPIVANADAPASEAVIQADYVDDEAWVAGIVDELSSAEDDFLPPSYHDIQRETVILGGQSDQPTSALKPAKRNFPPVPITEVAPLNPAMTFDVWLESVYKIFTRAGEHLFAEAAQWQPNNAVPFGNPNHCTSAFSVADIPHANEIVMFMDFTQGNGQAAKRQVVTNGVVCGKLAKLPCVVLYLNKNGKLIKRTIQAMNPNTGSARSQMALTKRCCNVWDNNRSDSGEFYEKCPLSLIENAEGRLQVHKTPKPTQ
jgi:hypothetical protein